MVVRSPDSYGCGGSPRLGQLAYTDSKVCSVFYVECLRTLNPKPRSVLLMFMAVVSGGGLEHIELL